jgi:glycosyltransferase involved in cell wall biosynthesis
MGADGQLLVAVSNLGGGISRHLELTRTAVELRVHELPETLALSTKVRTLRRLLLAGRHEIVVTHGVAAGLAARLRGRTLRRLRHVEFWHGDPFFASAGRRTAFRGLAAAGRAPDVQVFTHEWLKTMYGARGSDLVVLPNTVPIHPAATVAGAPAPGRHVAAFLGRFSPEKGFTDLLLGWPDDARSLGWELVMHGDGPLSRATMPAGVRVAGPTTRPLDVLAGAHLVVIPSRTETGPYVALESASVGRPFVGTRVGDMPEMVTGAGCGWLADPSSPSSLRETLRHTLTVDPEELDAAGFRGRQWLAGHRPFSAWQHRVAELYHP